MKPEKQVAKAVGDLLREARKVRRSGDPDLRAAFQEHKAQVMDLIAETEAADAVEAQQWAAEARAKAQQLRGENPG
jgi:hypothetical protein